MLQRIIIIVVSSYLLINPLFSQKYNFKNYSVSDGLTQSEIYAICEDQRGNIWFGSLGGGIMMFDGYTFTNFREEDGLANNFVRAIFEDNEGIMWIGTEEGLCTFNGIDFNIIDHEKGPGQHIVRVIIQDASGILWFGTENNGLFRYDGNEFIQFTIEDGLPDSEIYCLFEDKDQHIWIGTNKGVCSFNNNVITTLTHNEGLPNDVVRSICQDVKGNMWFATYGGGVSVYKGKEFKTYTVNDGLANNIVFSIFNDGNGNIWMGTANGISKYNGIFFKTFREEQGLANNVVVCIAKDVSGNVWFGTSGGGVSRFNSERFVHYTENENVGKYVYAITQAPNGNMIFGTSMGGISVFDGSRFTLLKGTRGFTSSKVKSLHYTPDSILWIGTLDDGIYKFDNERLTHYTASTGMNLNKISGFTRDLIGRIWVSGLDSGLCVYNEFRDTFITYNKSHGLGSNSINTLKADGKGNIWVGTSNGGLTRISFFLKKRAQPKFLNFTKENGLSNNTVKTIAIDSLNNLYLGTAGGGINIYDGKNFIHITREDGLSSNNIYLLIFDDKNHLWAGTEQGIDRITFAQDFSITECRHYGKDEGFTGIETYVNSCYKDNEGNLWFGTVYGATRYDPFEDIQYVKTPEIHITGIKLFFDDIRETSYADSLTGWYRLPLKLTLPYNKNNLSFEFLGIYQRFPESVQYKWILEGFNEEWSPALLQREVTFSNLPPGTYTFKVMASNENNVWNEESASFTFQILPPVWKEWWFRSIVILIVVLILWMIFFSRFKRIRRKNKITQEKLEMEKNIIELEQEAARLQMNPHFIFNSLNSIQGFIATNDAFQAKRYLAKFARLMRLILENAREEFIPLKNETDILENYLELEKLSTNKKFDFQINVDESIDPEILDIPPMMIQPFVENAIIHGIKKKEGKGLITINFRTDDQILVCEIVDNGVGRQETMKSKTEINTKHKSSGITVTRKRLQQFMTEKGLNTGVDIIDLNENGKAAGTKVLIRIPFEMY